MRPPAPGRLSRWASGSRRCAACWLRSVWRCWLSFPAYAAWHGASVVAFPGWVWLLPGLFAQAGIAVEALFRGYLFGRLRRSRSFWRAAALATAPFVVVHLILFATMPWPIALAAVLLSVILSFPGAPVRACWQHHLGAGTAALHGAGGDQGGRAAWRHRPSASVDGGKRCNSLAHSSVASCICARLAPISEPLLARPQLRWRSRNWRRRRVALSAAAPLYSSQ